MKSAIHEFEQCCWDLRGVLSTFGPDEVCCEGLTPRQCRVLRAVGESPELTLSELAKREGLTVGGMSRRVDPLVAGGHLVRRKGMTRDGRALRLELTRKGREALSSVEDLTYGSIEKLWGALPASQRPRVLAGLKALILAGQGARTSGCETNAAACAGTTRSERKARNPRRRIAP
jgi:DNA-binding MarR family transcriptional regulator